MHISDQQLKAIHECAASLYERHGEALLNGTVLEYLSAQQLWEWDNVLSAPTGSRLGLRLEQLKRLRPQITTISDRYQREHAELSGWITRFREMINGYAPLSHSDASKFSNGYKTVPFDALLNPLLQYAQDLLRTQCAVPSHISARALDEHAQFLLRRMSQVSAQCFYKSFIVFRNTHGGNDDIYQQFVSQMHAGEIIKFFEDYSCLARQITEIIDQWVFGTTLFFNRLKEDIGMIETQLFQGGRTGNVIGIQSGLTAMHTPSGNVHLLTFASGQQLLYKPRGAATDVLLSEVFQWFNTAGALPRLHCANVVDKGEYSWHAFVPHRSCKAASEVKRYYQRIGQIAAILQTLGSIDYHFGNLIASGEFPVLIDNETLLSPVTVWSPSRKLVSGTAGIESDLSRSLFLYGGELSMHSIARSITGVFDTTDRHRVIRYTHVNSSRMQQRNALWRNAGKNIPKHQRRQVDPYDSIDEMIVGYTQTLKLISERKQEFEDLVSRVTDNFNIQVRLLIRSSRQYEQLMFDSEKPNSLRDGITRSLLFEKLAVMHLSSNTPGLLWAEQEMMRQHLIPWFHISCNSNHDGPNSDYSAAIVRSAQQMFEQMMSKLNAQYIAGCVHTFRELLSEKK